MANENNTQNDPNTFDLDAALEEKFQEVQQDLKRMRAIDAATESKLCLLLRSRLRNRQMLPFPKFQKHLKTLHLKPHRKPRLWNRNPHQCRKHRLSPL